MTVPFKFGTYKVLQGSVVEPASEEALFRAVMRLIDEQYLRTPFFGSRQTATWLGRHRDEPVNRKRMQRLMRIMRIEAIYPRQRTTLRNLEHRVYPYLFFIKKRRGHTFRQSASRNSLLTKITR